MQLTLVMVREGSENRSFPIKKDNTVIGRREDCDLRIAIEAVSRKHCRIAVAGDSVIIEDLGSSNGTFVNGSKVKRTEVSAGDTIQVGPVAFVVQVDGEPAITDVKPVHKPSKAAAVDKDIEIDELDILNDSGGDSNVDLVDLDSPKP